MTTGYYIHERRPELEAVERWENEGGRLGRGPEHVVDAIREDYRNRRYMDQLTPIATFAKRDAVNKRAVALGASL